jgi:hypothetical protein
MNPLLFFAGLASLVLGVHPLVCGASKLAPSFGFSPLVARVLGSARLVTPGLVSLRKPRSGPLPS